MPDSDPSEHVPDHVASFFAACGRGELRTLVALLDERPDLVHERVGGTTGLHLAVRFPDAVRLLLEHGADPNVRDEGGNATPLHFAAGGAPIETVRELLNAGADPRGVGDLHELEAIGRATVFAEPRRDVVALLVERGARHHVFTAIALGDVELLRGVVAQDPDALGRRLSGFEGRQSALHYVTAPPDGLVGGTFRTGEHHRTLEALIELGADLDAPDGKGRTALDLAMLRGDVDAMRILHGAGVRMPVAAAARTDDDSVAAIRGSVHDPRPMLSVADMDGTIAWYRAIGFELTGAHGEHGALDWAAVTLGGAEIMFVPSRGQAAHATRNLSLWFETERLDGLYALLKRQQLEHARAVLSGAETDLPEGRFVQDLPEAFYGQREFGIVDPNGIELMFAQALE